MYHSLTSGKIRKKTGIDEYHVIAVDNAPPLPHTVAMKKTNAWGNKPKLGQHFLADRSICARIVEAAEIHSGDHVVEIGPGMGALTGLLASATPRLTLVEPDRELAFQMMLHHGKATILKEKAEDVDFSAMDGPLIVMSNLPYYASVFIFKHLIAHKRNITRMVLMFQKEVAHRIASEPGHRSYGSLSVLSAYHWAIEELMIVKPGSFDPPPKVDSAVLRFTPLAVPPVAVDEAVLFAVVKAAFAQKRRTLRNNLKGIYTAASMEEAMAAAKLGSNARAEETPLAAFALLAEHLQKPLRAPEE